MLIPTGFHALSDFFVCRFLARCLQRLGRLIRPSRTGVSFVRSTKIILTRCMKEKGVPPVGDTFDPAQKGRETARNMYESSRLSSTSALYRVPKAISGSVTALSSVAA